MAKGGDRAALGYPVVQKLRRGGYDGKGVKVLADASAPPFEDAPRAGRAGIEALSTTSFQTTLQRPRLPRPGRDAGETSTSPARRRRKNDRKRTSSRRARAANAPSRRRDASRLSRSPYRACPRRCVLEKKVAIAKELSVVVCRRGPADRAAYAPTECVFDPRGNVVQLIVAPAAVDDATAAAATALALRVVDELDFVGILAVELFLSTDGELLV